MANFVTLHAMRLGDAPRDWESHLRLVAPRYRERATGPAPEPTRLGEFAAGLLLASVLGVRDDAALSVMPGGKPELVAGNPRIGISHDDGIAVLATAHAPVGVDVECVPPAFRRRERSALGMVLSARDLALVEESADPALAFARAWTRVEAVLKAEGCGFGYPVRGGHLPPGWRVATFGLGAHVVSVAAREEPSVAVEWHPMARAITLLS